MPLTVVIAPDSFKGTLGAGEVAAAIAAGWRSVRPDDRLVLAPQADGGEGTLDAVAAAVPAATWHTVDDVTGPDGRPVRAQWLELPGGVAVVELAQSSGLPLMRRPDAPHATTRGLGEVIRAALDAGVDQLVIGLGGSATTDGGAGALAALGLGLVGVDSDGGGTLARLTAIDRTALRPPPPGGVVLLTDVAAPLLGAAGAAAVFGPQKGASPAQVAELDAALARFAELLGGDPTAPGSGAAGGTAFGFASAWGARIEPGHAWLARLSNLPETIARADVLLAGEGRFDEQSLGGKVVGELLALVRAPRADGGLATGTDGAPGARATRVGIRLGIIAGQVAATSDTWTIALTDLAGSVEAAIADPKRWLHKAGAAAARALAGD